MKNLEKKKNRVSKGLLDKFVINNKQNIIKKFKYKGKEKTHFCRCLSPKCIYINVLMGL